ncbi:Hypothetical predicted protein [Mytilus galloprovincialis]|uniref:Uncharacterized protein n=1 Tax=Mytilus galloprovincialis TaxID=29158 RepID=A0A8B6CJL5_MYTGA|nr:Hypothetical predicted protein [Mytilus galloprovincialis]
MFGYFITRKLGLATATSSSAKCLDISSQENWDLPLPHQVQQNVWIFHHKKTGTCHCHIKFSKMFGYFITRKLGLAIATLSSSKSIRESPCNCHCQGLDLFLYTGRSEIFSSQEHRMLTGFFFRAQEHWTFIDSFHSNTTNSSKKVQAFQEWNVLSKQTCLSHLQELILESLLVEWKTGIKSSKRPSRTWPLDFELGY